MSSLAVLDALDELEHGEHATKSRDFGRGVAFACKVIREALQNPVKEQNADTDG